MEIVDRADDCADDTFPHNSRFLPPQYGPVHLQASSAVVKGVEDSICACVRACVYVHVDVDVNVDVDVDVPYHIRPGGQYWVSKAGTQLGAPVASRITAAHEQIHRDLPDLRRRGCAQSLELRDDAVLAQALPQFQSQYVQHLLKQWNEVVALYYKCAGLNLHRRV